MAKVKDTIFTPRPVAVTADFVQVPARAIPIGATSIALSVDRTSLTGAQTGTMVEVAGDVSLDGGANWGGTYVDPADPTKQYPLEFSMTVPDGVQVFRGVTQTNTTITVDLPQTNNADRKIRLRYKVSLARTWGFSVDVAGPGL